MSSKKYPIYMHVNYLEVVMDLEEVINRCADAGYDGIELRGWDRSEQMQTAEYLAKMHGYTQKAGLGMVFVVRNDSANEDKSVRDKELENLKLSVEFAADKGIKTLNCFGSGMVREGAKYFDFDTNGSGLVSDKQWQLTVDYFKQAGEICVKNDVQLCFETHNCYIHDMGEPTAKLVKDIGCPNIKVNFDYGNMLLNNKNQGLEKEFEFIKDMIGYMHLKNMQTLKDRNGDQGLFWATPLAEGDINNYVLVKLLFESGYEGILTIENTMAGDKRPLMVRDREYLQQIVDELS